MGCASALKVIEQRLERIAQNLPARVVGAGARCLRLDVRPKGGWVATSANEPREIVARRRVIQQHLAATFVFGCRRISARRVREHSGAQPETLTHRALPSCQSRETRLIRARGANCDQSSWKRDLLHGSLTVDCGYQCPRRASPCLRGQYEDRLRACTEMQIKHFADDRQLAAGLQRSPGPSAVRSARQGRAPWRDGRPGPTRGFVHRPTGGRADAHHRRSHARAARSRL